MEFAWAILVLLGLVLSVAWMMRPPRSDTTYKVERQSR